MSDTNGLFAGASRVASYEDPEDRPVLAGLTPGAPSPRHVTESSTPHDRDDMSHMSLSSPARWGTEDDQYASVGEQSATSGRGGRVRGVVQGLRRNRGAERAGQVADAERVIRQATWTRPVNVLVASVKGGVGRTPVTLVLAGVLGLVRGGYVAAFEATQDRGDLVDRAEGSPSRGLSELLAAGPAASSAAAVGGYASPQSSHCDVFGSAMPREELTGEDVRAVRRVLDQHYRVTVTDTSVNQLCEAFAAATATADAVVIPVTPTPGALSAVSRTLMHLADHGRTDLLGRVVALVTHDGGWEDSAVAASLPDRLYDLGVRHVVEVPYDLELRRGGEITVENLSKTSRQAWVLAAAKVVDALLDAPDDLPDSTVRS